MAKVACESSYCEIRVSLVGRTGAGKSSLIQALFRMATLVDGRIIIDNIDINTVALNDVRPRITVIPQDPVLFTGSFRSNLDEFDKYSDAEVWCALEQVQLKSFVNEILPNGLRSIINEGGSNLSAGQKQLICLARAFLKKNKILIVDEATANVDNATDELIQCAIRDKFKECTVLTVAHRLRTVIDSDRILVLNNGKLLEYGSPRVLLTDSKSHFASLVEETGPAEVQHLRTLAESVVATKIKQTVGELEDDQLSITVETDSLLP